MNEKRAFSAIVPVAGAGTRLKPHTYTYPKVLLTVGHKPIIGHILDQLISIGRPTVYMVIGYLGDKIKEYVGKNYPDLDVVYVEQPEPKGLGHAIALTDGLVKGPVFVLLGDTILDGDMARFVRFEEDCIGVKTVADPRRFGVVETGPDGYVRTMVEKPANPTSNLAIVGAYSFVDAAEMYTALRELVASGQTTKGEIQFTDALVKMVEKGAKIRPLQIDGWYDCGKPETLLSTNRYLLEHHAEKLACSVEGSLLVPPVFIDKTAIIENSIVGPYASVGAGVHISSAIVRDSIINEDAQLSRVILSASLIGPGATMSGHVQHINIGENSEIILDSSQDA